MKDQIEVGLRELKAQGERSDVPPSFRLQDGLEADIKIEEGFFLEDCP